ncbi:MAG TPA: sugar phosphate nucleotidyltransferase [Chitinophagaceae bacterium]|nr:sugar phosphate nucleotidyltransferase [Chitinophagaceae bacterium]
MKPTLLILAAGMASRYGSMKQIEGFGPGGETIMDYSIYDAIRAGFGKVVFIIREEFADNFKAIFEPRLRGRIETDYVYQEMDRFTEGYPIPADRKKPWGTAHAVLCAQQAIREPFAVINADDFYGQDAFRKAHGFLVDGCDAKRFAIIGYDLLKTLSDHGTVNRGVCRVDAQGHLSSIVERLNIARAEGRILCDDEHEPKELPLSTHVSMNFWCFHPAIFPYTARMFREFLQQHGTKPKSEFFIPIVADQFIREGGVIDLIPTTAQWFGVTYKEDAPGVQQSLDTLIRDGEYPSHLW